MSSAQDRLSNFFLSLGIAQQQIEASRQLLHSHKSFNLEAAYEIFDRELKGWIEEEDVERVIEESGLEMSDAWFVMAMLDTSGKGRVTPERFAVRVSGSSDKGVMKELQSRRKVKMDQKSTEVLFGFVRTLGVLGKDIEAARQALKEFDPKMLFSMIDTARKGCVSFQQLKTFLMLYGTVSTGLLNSIKKALAERQALTLFSPTFNQLITPNDFIKTSLQSPSFKAATSRVSQLTNQDWRAELQRNQLIRHKILDEVAQRSAKCSAISLNPLTTNYSVTTKKQTQARKQTNYLCKELVEKIDSLKKTLIRHSASSSQVVSGDIMMSTYKDSEVNGVFQAKTRRTEESVFQSESAVAIQRARIEAKARIQEIQNLARLKVYSSRPKTPLGVVPLGVATSSLNYEAQKKLKQLQEEKSRSILLEKQLNRSKSKIKKLQSQIEVYKPSTASRFGLVSPRNSVIGVPTTKRAKMLTQQQEVPEYLRNKTKRINLDYEKLKSKLETQKRLRSIM